MSSERSSTAVNSPKRLVMPDNSTATSRPVSGRAPLVPGGCSVVSLSCNSLPPVCVAPRKLALREIVRAGNGSLRATTERREDLPRRPLAGLNCPFHVPAPLGGGLGPGPVDASYRFGQRRTVIQKHTRHGHPRVSAARVDFGPPICLRVGQRAEGILPKVAGEA